MIVRDGTLRYVPFSVLVPLALVLYALSIADGSWRGVPFAERVIRLFPFLLLGLASFEICDRFAKYTYAYWPLLIAGYALAAPLIYFSPLSAWAPVTFAASALGIAAVIAFAEWVSHRSARTVFLYIGGASLYIYLGHRLVQAAIDILWHLLGWDFVAGSTSWVVQEALVTVLAIVLCAVTGYWMKAQDRFNWLFTAPWQDNLALMGKQRNS